jgi:putative hydrolase of the HAD superfamily
MKALLVDLDDTLLDYSGGVDECWTAACETGAGPAGIDTAALVEAVRTARRWFWDDPDRHRRERVNMMTAWGKIVAHGLERMGAPNASLAAIVAEEFAARRWDAMRLFPGVTDALGRLRDGGVALALVTNGDKSQQRAKIERYDLGGYFDVIQIEGEFGAGKPEARAYEHALRTVRVSPAEAWMVGDNLEWDVRGAQQVGILGIWRDVAGAGLPSPSPAQPDRIIRSLTDLLPA